MEEERKFQENDEGPKILVAFKHLGCHKNHKISSCNQIHLIEPHHLYDNDCNSGWIPENPPTKTTLGLYFYPCCQQQINKENPTEILDTQSYPLGVWFPLRKPCLGAFPSQSCKGPELPKSFQVPGSSN
jgi:hypothetical protein